MTNRYVDIRDEYAEKARIPPSGLMGFAPPKYEEEEEEGKAWWEKIPGVGVAGDVLGWATENILDPFGATMWAGVSPREVEGTPSWTQFLGGTPPAAAGVAWAQKGMELPKQYHEEVPWYQKLGYEAPLFAAPGTGVVKGGQALKAAGKLPWLTKPAGAGIEMAGKGIVGAERLAGGIVTAPLKPIAKPLARRAGQVAAKRLAPLELEASEEILLRRLREDWFLKLSRTGGKVPVLRQIIRGTFGPVATLDPEDLVSVSRILRGEIDESLNSGRTIVMGRVRAGRDPIEVLGIDENAICTAVNPLKRDPQSNALYDILDNPRAYKLTPEQKEVVDRLRWANKEIDDLLSREGLRPPAYEAGGTRFHRMVEGIEVEGELIPRPRASVKGRAGMVKRIYPTQAEGMRANVRYQRDPIRALDERLKASSQLVAHERTMAVVRPLWRTPKERMPYAVRLQSAMDKTTYRHGRDTLDAIKRAARGERLPGATMGMIEREFPETAQAIRGVYALPANEQRKAFTALSKKFQGEVSSLKQIAAKSGRARAVAMEKARRPGWRTLTEEEARLAAISKKEPGWHTATAKDVARRPELTEGQRVITVPEGVVSKPAFSGRILPAPAAERLEVVLGDQGNQWLRKMSMVSAWGRMSVAALDVSAPFIQGLPVLGRNPKAWAKGVEKHFEFLVSRDRKGLYRWMNENEAILLEMRSHGSIIQSFEYFEALENISRFPSKARRALEQTYGRAEAAFTGYSMVARVEMWKAMAPGIGAKHGEQGLADLARSLDRMTGIMSTSALGIGASQRSFEAAFLFFSPRYTRAGFAFVSDFFKGRGVSGGMARRSLGQLAGGATAFYIGICHALGQEPHLDPRDSRFMTIEAGGRNLGVGGFQYSLLRFGSNVVAGMQSVADDEKDVTDLIGLNRWDNPFLRFMRSRSAPLTGMISEVIEQENFFGEPYEDPEDWLRFVGGKTLPIWVQSQVVEGAGAHPVAAAAEMAGMRTFPISTSEERNRIQNQFAQADYGMDWTELERDQQDKLRTAHPEIEEAETKAMEIRVERGGAEERKWADWRGSSQYIQDEWLQQAQGYSDQLQSNQITGTQFRDLMHDINVGKRNQYELMRQQYPDLYEALSDPSRVDEDKKFDVALFEWYRDVVGDPELETPQGFNYEKYQQNIAAWTQKWTSQMYQRVQEYFQRNDPPMVKMYNQAKEALRPYWEVRVWLIRKYGLEGLDQYIRQLELTDPMKADFVRKNSPMADVERMVTAMREQIRLQNPQLAELYETFYGDTAPMGAQQRVMEQQRELAMAQR